MAAHPAGEVWPEMGRRRDVAESRDDPAEYLEEVERAVRVAATAIDSDR